MSWNANETTIKFHRACRDLDLETVHNLLRIEKEKIDVKQLDKMGTLLNTVRFSEIFTSFDTLQEALEKDPNVEVVKVLCEIGVDLEQKDEYGKTALGLECCGKNIAIYGSGVKYHSNPRIVKTLLEHGASVHAKDIHGSTPLLAACGSEMLEVVQTPCRCKCNHCNGGNSLA